jgi:hypothetical protein
MTSRSIYYADHRPQESRHTVPAASRFSGLNEGLPPSFRLLLLNPLEPLPPLPPENRVYFCEGYRKDATRWGDAVEHPMEQEE